MVVSHLTRTCSPRPSVSALHPFLCSFSALGGDPNPMGQGVRVNMVKYMRVKELSDMSYDFEVNDEPVTFTFNKVVFFQKGKQGLVVAVKDTTFCACLRLDGCCLVGCWPHCFPSFVLRWLCVCVCVCVCVLPPYQTLRCVTATSPNSRRRWAPKASPLARTGPMALMHKVGSVFWVGLVVFFSLFRCVCHAFIFCSVTSLSFFAGVPLAPRPVSPWRVVTCRRRNRTAETTTHPHKPMQLTF